VVAPLLLVLALSPWSHPLRFAPLPGWTTGRSGDVPSAYGGSTESAAWIASGVRYRDAATADPPNETLRHLGPGDVIVWAVAYAPPARGPRLRLDLRRARHLACCEAVPVAAEWELAGNGRDRRYSVIVRVYFGSRPTAALRARARRALDRIDLP
jgi:hypothetical protein